MVQEITFNDITLSFARWFIGLLLGSLLGLAFALLGNYKYSRLSLKIINDFLRAIPILALVPVIQMNIGINEYGKIGLIAWAVMFVVWITVRSSIEKNIENANLTLVATKISGYRYFKVFTFPKVFGGFLKGVELGIGIAWLASVAAESIGTFSKGFWAGGIGYKLFLGYEVNDWKTVHLCILIFGLLGLTTAYFWRFLIYLFFERNKYNKGFNPVIKEVNL